MGEAFHLRLLLDEGLVGSLRAEKYY